MVDKTPIEKERILLVEGRDTRDFFEMLARQLGLLGRIQVIDFGSVDSLRDMLSAIALQTTNFDNITHIGIVRDYEYVANPFQSMCDSLKHVNLPIPENPYELIGDDLKVIVGILPDANTPGMLEDLCLRAFQNDIAVPCVDQFFDCLEERNIMLLPTALSKARLRLIIASKSVDAEIPKKQRRVFDIHWAMMKRWWPWDSPAFDLVKGFLRQLAEG